jgi:CDGSH-type Zn-finger protein
MDDSSKKAASAADRESKKPKTASSDSSESFVAYMNDPAEQAGGAESQQEENLTTSAKAVDRWFRERRTLQGAPRLLEVPNEALVSNGGPLQITGNIALIGEDGSVQYANHLTLCRCGASKSKPDCDEQHLECEFLHSGKITEVSELKASQRACRITISCIKDGPITFSGSLRLHNRYDQECVKLRGSLCRCGHSANKPFCDGSHERVGFRTQSG